MKKVLRRVDYLIWSIRYEWGRRYKGFRKSERGEAHKGAIKEWQWEIREWNRKNIKKERRVRNENGSKNVT